MEKETTITPAPFTLWLPIDMEKSIDAGGERLICGIISTEDTDLQGEQVMEQLANYHPMLTAKSNNLAAAMADQVDWSRFSKSQGWLKWEHEPEPESIIGWPERIEKGMVYSDPNTGLRKSGTAMWGELFPASAGLKKADDAWGLIQAIRKSGVKRRLGYSIEGAYMPLKDLPSTQKACMVTNVVLTTKPVNSWAWADMAKALMAGGPGSGTDIASLTGGAALRLQSHDSGGVHRGNDKKKKCEHDDDDLSIKKALDHLVLCCGYDIPTAREIVLRSSRRAA